MPARRRRLLLLFLLYRGELCMSLASRVVTTMTKGENVQHAKGLLMILSPAKTLDLTPCSQGSLDWTTPDCSESQTRKVASVMKQRKEKELVKLLGISANLAKKAHEYWSNFEVDPNDRDESEKKPCIYAFSGAAYQGLQASSCSESAIGYLQDSLRIVDPLYGVLRPLDVIQPYRLEMATRNFFPDETKVKLAEWWKPAVTECLSRDLALRPDMVLINLASDEYASAVDPSGLPDGTKFIKIVFWEQGRVIAVHAKRARGLMARYLAENDIQNVDGVQKFSEEGYHFVSDKSDETTLVFDREKQSASKPKRAKQPAGGSKKRTRKG